MKRTAPQVVAAPARVLTLNRLSASAYAGLEKETYGKLPKVPANPHDATFLAGVEFVLRALRTGYVIEDQQ
jgi:hypothetical protein